MLYFPQLSSGATGQFPVTRQRTLRTVVNESTQGYDVKLADPAAAVTEWNLSFEELTDQELAALEALFQAAEGRLTPFTFLDPAGNLLAWSEQLNQPVWQADPLLTLSPNVADPFGGTAAYQVENPTAAVLQLQQTINAPASLNYCLSVHVRSDQTSQISLVRGTESTSKAVTSEWTRLISAGQVHSDAESMNFGIALDPGTTVQVFGFQAEAQTSASLYQQTTEIGSVYPAARFRDDTMTIRTVGPGRHSCSVNIINVEHL